MLYALLPAWCFCMSFFSMLACPLFSESYTNGTFSAFSRNNARKPFLFEVCGTLESPWVVFWALVGLPRARVLDFLCLSFWGVLEVHSGALWAVTWVAFFSTSW